MNAIIVVKNFVLCRLISRLIFKMSSFIQCTFCQAEHRFLSQFVKYPTVIYRLIKYFLKVAVIAEFWTSKSCNLTIFSEFNLVALFAVSLLVSV